MTTSVGETVPAGTREPSLIEEAMPSRSTCCRASAALAAAGSPALTSKSSTAPGSAMLLATVCE